MTLKWEASAFKNPMARARGLGSLHEGVHHWMAQRISALAILVLGIWAVCSVVTLAQGTYADLETWMETLCNPVLLSLFIMATFYHTSIGLQVVVEDYVHCELSKKLILAAIHLSMFAGATLAIFSILKLAL